MTSEQYARRVIALFLVLPGVSGRAARADWTLARTLHKRGTSIDIVEAALLLAVSRRAARDADSPPLSPIRSLAYFQPVIEELIAQPLPPSYVNYLREVVSTLLQPDPARFRKHALLHDR